MNERNTFFIKIYLSFYSLKGPTVCCCLRDRWRDIYSERGLLLPISSTRSHGVPTLALPCKLIRDELIGCVPHAWLRFSTLCLNLTAWLSRGLLPVTHLLYLSALIVLLCILITRWQLGIAHGVTRNEPKIHGICYIKFTLSNNLWWLPMMDQRRSGQFR